MDHSMLLYKVISINRNSKNNELLISWNNIGAKMVVICQNWYPIDNHCII